MRPTSIACFVVFGVTIVWTAQCGLFTDTEDLSGSTPTTLDGGANEAAIVDATAVDAPTVDAPALDGSQADGGTTPACNGVYCEDFEKGNIGDPCFGWETFVNSSLEVIGDNCHGSSRCCMVCATSTSYNGSGEISPIVPIALDGGVYQMTAWFRSEERSGVKDGGPVDVSSVLRFTYEDGGTSFFGNSATVGSTWQVVSTGGIVAGKAAGNPRMFTTTGLYRVCYVIDDVRVIAQ